MGDTAGWDVLLVRLFAFSTFNSLDKLAAGRFKLLLGQGDNDDSQELVRTKAYENGVLALPGTVFFPNGARTSYVRASFSLLEEHDVDEALRRLGETIRKERGGA